MIAIKILYWSIAVIIIGAYVLVYGKAAHKTLYEKSLYYKWLYESVSYRFNLYRIKKKSHEEKIKIHSTHVAYGHWSLNYWFGRKINKYLENYIYETEINN